MSKPKRVLMFLNQEEVNALSHVHMVLYELKCQQEKELNEFYPKTTKNDRQKEGFSWHKEFQKDIRKLNDALLIIEEMIN